MGGNPITRFDPLGLQCACGKSGDSGRKGNPNFNKNLLKGFGIGAAVGIVAINIIGFPEAEAVEGAGAVSFASLGAFDGATALAFVDAIGGEPIGARFAVSLAGAANGGPVGALIGFLVTPPQSADCP